MMWLLASYVIAGFCYAFIVGCIVSSMVDHGDRLDAHDRFFRDHSFPAIVFWPVTLIVWSGSRFSAAVTELARQRKRRLTRQRRLQSLSGKRRRSTTDALKKFDQQLAVARAKKIVKESVR